MIAEETDSFVAARYVAINDTVVAGANSCRGSVLPHFAKVLLILEFYTVFILAIDILAANPATA